MLRRPGATGAQRGRTPRAGVGQAQKASEEQGLPRHLGSSPLILDRWGGQVLKGRGEGKE